LLVRDIMSRNAITVKPDTAVLEAEKLMSLNKIGQLIVMENNQVIGMLSEGNLVVEHQLNAPIRKFMSRNIHKINQNTTVKEAARILTDHKISGLPVLDENKNLVGIVTAGDIVYGYLEEEEEERAIEKKTITPESSAIYLAMTRSREYEDYWLEKIRGYGYSGAITQTGASAEKLPIKLRESTTVAAIARGVINENSREKIAISNAVKDAYSQLALINPGLGGGFKIAIVRGDDHISVAIFGKFGHALVDGPEQLTVGISII
jgi:acetoin utilization protein AcuB